MRFLKFSVAALALSLAGQASNASTYVTYEGKAGYGHASVSPAAGETGPSYSGRAAAFRMHDAANGLGLDTDFIAFCIDLAGYVGSDNYYINNDAPFDPERKLTDFQIMNVGNLFQASYAHVDTSNNTQAAAFQLALWEAAYETDDNTALALTTGKRIGGSNDADILTTANDYLTKLANWDGTIRFKVDFLDAEMDNRQDLVTATPVPVPTAGLMLIGGLGALSLMKRRKDKQKT